MSEEINPLPDPMSPEVRACLQRVEAAAKEIYRQFFAPLNDQLRYQQMAEESRQRTKQYDADWTPVVRQLQLRHRLKSLCRVAYIVDGREGWAPWQPITWKRTMEGAVREIMSEQKPGVRAWVEVR